MKQSDIDRQEQLSALLDNALEGQQLDRFMQDLKRDPVAEAESAQRYRMMGDAMRDELDQSSFIDVSAAVHRALEQEETYTTSADASNASVWQRFVLAFGEKANQFSGKTVSTIQAWLRPLTGLAVAASVAMMTLFTFNTVQNTESETSEVQLAATGSTSPVLVNPAKINAEFSRNVRVASTVDLQNPTAEQQKQINSYMLQHSSYASQATMQGMMPYVRAADMQAHEVDVRVQTVAD